MGGPWEDFVLCVVGAVKLERWLRLTFQKGSLPPVGQLGGGDWAGTRGGGHGERKWLQDVFGGGTNRTRNWVAWGQGPLSLLSWAAGDEGLSPRDRQLWFLVYDRFLSPAHLEAQIPSASFTLS